MNVHSKNGSRGARSRTPKLPLCYYLSATSRTPWNVCEELRPQNLLKNERDGFRSPGRSSQTIAYICDLLGQARKRSRAFAISWEKLANDRVHFRSLGRSSQTIACICDLLGKARKRSRAFAISERCMEGMGTVDKAYSSTLIRVECRRFIDRMRLE